MAEKKVKKSKMGEGVKPTILPHFTSTIERAAQHAYEDCTALDKCIHEGKLIQNSKLNGGGVT